MEDRLEFRYSRLKQAAMLAVSCVLVAGCGFIAATSEDVVYRGAGWLGAGFFLLCGAVAAKRLLSGGVPFVFDLAGIAFPGGNFGLVPWSEIKSCAVVTVRGHDFLAITFHDPARILSRVSAAKRRLAFANERLGWGHWALTFSGVTPGMDEALRFIRDHALVPPES